MLAIRHALPSGSVFRWLCLSLLCVTVANAGKPISHPSPPREPSIPPSIARQFSTDKNADRIQDSLSERAQKLESTANNPARPADHMDARQQLDNTVEVELIFSRRISQQQLDDFVASKGEVTHLYETVSYGWNGHLPLGKIRALPQLMGDTLVQIEEDQPAVLHLDQATRNGRVRPIWAAGFAENELGFDGDTNITISVLDSGVDGTHMDLKVAMYFGMITRPTTNHFRLTASNTARIAPVSRSAHAQRRERRRAICRSLMKVISPA